MEVNDKPLNPSPPPSKVVLPPLQAENDFNGGVTGWDLNFDIGLRFAAGHFFFETIRKLVMRVTSFILLVFKKQYISNAPFKAYSITLV